MKAVTVKEIKEELNLRTPKEVRELCFYKALHEDLQIDYEKELVDLTK